MGQVTIYLDAEHERRMKDAARAAGIPVSRWLAKLVEEKTHTDWPESVKQLAGSWNDLPEPEGRREPTASDSKRGKL